MGHNSTMSKPKPKEKYEFEGYRISKEENDYICDLQTHLLVKKWLPTVGLAALFSMGSMATIGIYGRLRGVKYSKSIRGMWGFTGFVGGAAASAWDTKQFVQSRKILEEMPKSRLAFKVRDDMSSIYESSIMSSDECLSELEFKRPDYWQIKVPIISCITAANLGIYTALGPGINFVGALLVSWPAYEGLYYGVNRVRIWYVTYEIAEKKKCLRKYKKNWHS